MIKDIILNCFIPELVQAGLDILIWDFSYPLGGGVHELLPFIVIDDQSGSSGDGTVISLLCNE